ncbi:hypothetical protein GLOTRDRAFT_134521 [Gloeophyllum trabeum ATCC 11539]|uniref:Uncharacterized protein n=1 Tax=Gloeophyllum trabeum (strain ATCC 11539 / FP-39264 / Madison 617) TaxID=670483 RepID=S7R653_GLOTA|nr:uncharacterized protein GLOTRDRAFT_134521 [Gloeophyllum trabeum ATCC 11539]EPQ49865.1 hypothetical protein GLOTRDRAFT_134521 [Gloeophyllum trabeum ATCC 11539]
MAGGYLTKLWQKGMHTSPIPAPDRPETTRDQHPPSPQPFEKRVRPPHPVPTAGAAAVAAVTLPDGPPRGDIKSCRAA